eukprot:7248085-Prymnesium_polylepis.1
MFAPSRTLLTWSSPGAGLAQRFDREVMSEVDREVMGLRVCHGYVRVGWGENRKSKRNYTPYWSILGSYVESLGGEVVGGREVFPQKVCGSKGPTLWMGGETENWEFLELAGSLLALPGLSSTAPNPKRAVMMRHLVGSAVTR